MREVTDPELLRQLNGASSTEGLKEVTDPELLKKLNTSSERGPVAEGFRQVGLATRYGLEGNLPVVAADVLGSAMNAIPGVNIAPTSKTIGSFLTSIGFPEPETSEERIVGDASKAAVAAMSGGPIGGLLKAGQPMFSNAAAIGEALSSTPLLQATSGALAGGAGGGMREAGGTEGQQLAASLLAGFAPGTIVHGGQLAKSGLARMLLGGADQKQTIADNIESFNRIGITPSVGQATEGRLSRGAESLLSKTPGSAGVMAERAKEQAEGISNHINQMAESLSPRMDPTKAGRAIDKGISSFVSDFRKESNDLYDRLDSYIQPTQQVSPQNTITLLQKLTTPVSGAEATSGRLINSTLQEVNAALKKDLRKVDFDYVQGASGRDTLPYSALKDLRTMIGYKLGSNELVSDIPKAQLKQLYGAITEDMKIAAQEAGPDALKALNRANNYYRAGTSRIEALDATANKGSPEEIFSSAVSGSKEGATKLRSIMRSLPPEGKKAVSSTMLKRLGAATPGNQNDAGSVFSAETFLTNWNRLSPEARDVLFSGYGRQFTEDMGHLTKIASNLREGSRVFSNPSGTDAALANRATIGTFLLSLGTGNLGVATGIAAGSGATYAMGKVMTNPNTIRWLAQNSNKPVSALPVAIANLQRWAENNNDPETLEAAESLKETINSNQR